MIEKTEINKPIEIKDNSKERVAYDLMEKIASYERGGNSSRSEEVVQQQRTRDYWFKLYDQSLTAIGGYYESDS